MGNKWEVKLNIKKSDKYFLHFFLSVFRDYLLDLMGFLVIVRFKSEIVY